MAVASIARHNLTVLRALRSSQDESTVSDSRYTLRSHTAGDRFHVGNYRICVESRAKQLAVQEGRSRQLRQRSLSKTNVLYEPKIYFSPSELRTFNSVPSGERKSTTPFRRRQQAVAEMSIICQYCRLFSDEFLHFNDAFATAMSAFTFFSDDPPAGLAQETGARSVTPQ